MNHANIGGNSHSKAIVAWIKSIPNAPEDDEIIEVWLLAVPPKSMTDAVDLFLAFAKHLALYGLSDMYIRIASAIDEGNSPWGHCNNFAGGQNAKWYSL